MRFAWRGFAAIAAVALLTAGWLAVDERSRWLAMNRDGQLTKGCALGVCVGDARDEALGTLRRHGLTDVLEVAGGSSEAPNVEAGRTLVSIRDNSWRNGVFSLEIADGRVAAISWSYVGPFYLDF